MLGVELILFALLLIVLANPTYVLMAAIISVIFFRRKK